MFRLFVIKLLNPILGKKISIGFFKKLYFLSLKGMNYGVVSSGEDHLILELLNVKKHSEQKLIIFDVGANIGQYSKLLQVNLKRDFLVFAFEPSKKTFEAYNENIIDSRFLSYNIGLGKANEIVNLYSNSEFSTLASVNPREINGEKMTVTEKIKIFTLDTFCLENTILKIDFLKIDVEGNELNVLEGAKNMISNKKIQFIQFEFGGTCIASRVFFKDFWDLLNKDYFIYRLLRNSMLLIENYSEDLEIFCYSNFIAKLKE